MSADHPRDPLDEYGIPTIPDPSEAASRKRRAIIDAALAEFLAEGYSAASMDSITKRSGVSKATVYKHVGSKERLFLAVVGGVLPQTYADLTPAGTTLATAPDLRTGLIRHTTELARILLRPEIMSLRRLVIGEIDRFPQLGALWYRVTYDMNNAPLVEALTALATRGELDLPDPSLAVQQLFAATAGIPQLIHTFAPTTPADPATLATQIAAGVDLFLARYTPRPSAGAA
ncbi:MULTISPECIES: TetR/AcrR family transcriptional regulator [Kitasatospora]|uniref:Putative TetR family transcriptional regulator n=1 Tax=Kitasatospora setae (strain ATCC 33774 / DSM 43861 / JCM 3304 / KCC A-0304 / NBRC 14216 / KM-6054) TaxID=452652 RepID=E4N6L1_KITSK|nr:MULTISPECIES: TetR/AcrR family transcriptional regulator [Kitasatospora]BAJ26842.1 putative TetR family transcriptional regulator [Kitasatospora setae KM-6054]